jgi:hypothetical protein
LFLAFSAQPAGAQEPRIPPYDGYRFHDERGVDRFVVQRWVNAASPDPSPAGECDCVIVVYAGTRQVLTAGTPGSVSAISVAPPTGTDLDGDGATDLVVSTWSGGAHCCYSTAAYSVGRDVRPLLMLDTGDCGPGEFADLDGDGVLEFSTCDEIWKDTYCSFALTPFPTVVLAYDRARHLYRIATPRFARHFKNQFDSDLAETTRHFAESAGKDAGDDTCAVLRPALDLMYTGRMNEGTALIRRLYRGPDLDAFVKNVISKTRGSPLWVAR